MRLQDVDSVVPVVLAAIRRGLERFRCRSCWLLSGDSEEVVLGRLGPSCRPARPSRACPFKNNKRSFLNPGQECTQQLEQLFFFFFKLNGVFREIYSPIFPPLWHSPTEPSGRHPALEPTTSFPTCEEPRG